MNITVREERFDLNDVASNLERLKSIKLESYTYTIEKAKIRELAIAIGDQRDSYLNGEALPPTFAAVVEYWGGQSSASALLGLDVARVLHGEQEYEYVGEMNPGDEITVNAIIEDAYSKAAMTFIVMKKEFVNQHGELVLISRATIIEKH
ncbi:hypothetical protein CSV62_08950 [Sporosarcina sp. P35]|nr:hypothetical protein CSV62_08950 [Sporosarcina sp. P35]